MGHRHRNTQTTPKGWIGAAPTGNTSHRQRSSTRNAPPSPWRRPTEDKPLSPPAPSLPTMSHTGLATVIQGKLPWSAASCVATRPSSPLAPPHEVALHRTNTRRAGLAAIGRCKLSNRYSNSCRKPSIYRTTSTRSDRTLLEPKPPSCLVKKQQCRTGPPATKKTTTAQTHQQSTSAGHLLPRRPLPTSWSPLAHGPAKPSPSNAKQRSCPHNTAAMSTSWPPSATAYPHPSSPRLGVHPLYHMTR